MATAVDVIMAVGLEAAHAICRIDGIRRAFVFEDELERSAELAALRAFAEQDIRRTAQRTGILIYVALLEHRVIVLGDEAIDRALGPDECWEDVVAFVLDGIRARQAADGIARAVRRCGEMLAHTLPPLEGDRDEIPDRPILSD